MAHALVIPQNSTRTLVSRENIVPLLRVRGLCESREALGRVVEGRWQEHEPTGHNKAPDLSTVSPLKKTVV